MANKTKKPGSPNQEALLKFIQERFAETKQPITEREVLAAHVIPSRFRITTTVALLDRGLIAVHSIGTAAWVPAGC